MAEAEEPEPEPEPEEPEPEAVYEEPEEETTVLSTVTFKPYEDYRCITDQSSLQWQLIQQAYHEPDGRLTIDGFTLVALGRYWGPVGTRYEATIGGKTVYILKGDAKADCDTMACDGFCGPDGHIIELIVDTDLLSEEVIYHGDCSLIPELAGQIEKIEVIE